MLIDLVSFNNINQFKSPKIYEASMSVITEILDLYLFAEEQTELERTGGFMSFFYFLT